MIEEMIACVAYHHHEMTAEEACLYLGLSTRDELAAILRKQGFLMDARLVHDYVEKIDPEEEQELLDILAENDFISGEELKQELNLI